MNVSKWCGLNIHRKICICEYFFHFHFAISSTYQHAYVPLKLTQKFILLFGLWCGNATLFTLWHNCHFLLIGIFLYCFSELPQRTIIHTASNCTSISGRHVWVLAAIRMLHLAFLFIPRTLSFCFPIFCNASTSIYYRIIDFLCKNFALACFENGSLQNNAALSRISHVVRCSIKIGGGILYTNRINGDLSFWAWRNFNWESLKTAIRKCQGDAPTYICIEKQRDSLRRLDNLCETWTNCIHKLSCELIDLNN